MGLIPRQPSKKAVAIRALEVQVMELKAAAERADGARRNNISEIMANSNKQLDMVKADRDYHRSEVELLRAQISDMQANKQKLESSTQERAKLMEQAIVEIKGLKSQMEEKTGFVTELEKANQILVKENEKLELQREEELGHLRRLREERETETAAMLKQKDQELERCRGLQEVLEKQLADKDAQLLEMYDTSCQSLQSLELLDAAEEMKAIATHNKALASKLLEQDSQLAILQVENQNQSAIIKEMSMQNQRLTSELEKKVGELHTERKEREEEKTMLQADSQILEAENQVLEAQLKSLQAELEETSRAAGRIKHDMQVLCLETKDKFLELETSRNELHKIREDLRVKQQFCDQQQLRTSSMAPAVPLYQGTALFHTYVPGSPEHQQELLYDLQASKADISQLQLQLQDMKLALDNARKENASFRRTLQERSSYMDHRTHPWSPPNQSSMYACDLCQGMPGNSVPISPKKHARQHHESTSPGRFESPEKDSPTWRDHDESPGTDESLERKQQQLHILYLADSKSWNRTNRVEGDIHCHC